jgi:hypothetical protein
VASTGIMSGLSAADRAAVDAQLVEVRAGCGLVGMGWWAWVEVRAGCGLVGVHACRGRPLHPLPGVAQPLRTRREHTRCREGVSRSARVRVEHTAGGGMGCGSRVASNPVAFVRTGERGLG